MRTGYQLPKCSAVLSHPERESDDSRADCMDRRTTTTLFRGTQSTSVSVEHSGAPRRVRNDDFATRRSEHNLLTLLPIEIINRIYDFLSDDVDDLRSLESASRKPLHFTKCTRLIAPHWPTLGPNDGNDELNRAVRESDWERDEIQRSPYVSRFHRGLPTTSYSQRAICQTTRLLASIPDLSRLESFRGFTWSSRLGTPTATSSTYEEYVPQIISQLQRARHLKQLIFFNAHLPHVNPHLDLFQLPTLRDLGVPSLSHSEIGLLAEAVPHLEVLRLFQWIPSVHTKAEVHHRFPSSLTRFWACIKYDVPVGLRKKPGMLDAVAHLWTGAPYLHTMRVEAHHAIAMHLVQPRASIQRPREQCITEMNRFFAAIAPYTHHLRVFQLDTLDWDYMPIDQRLPQGITHLLAPIVVRRGHGATPATFLDRAYTDVDAVQTLRRHCTIHLMVPFRRNMNFSEIPTLFTLRESNLPWSQALCIFDRVVAQLRELLVLLPLWRGQPSVFNAQQENALAAFRSALFEEFLYYLDVEKHYRLHASDFNESLFQYMHSVSSETHPSLLFKFGRVSQMLIGLNDAFVSVFNDEATLHVASNSIAYFDHTISDPTAIADNLARSHLKWPSHRIAAVHMPDLDACNSQHWALEFISVYPEQRHNPNFYKLIFLRTLNVWIERVNGAFERCAGFSFDILRTAAHAVAQTPDVFGSIEVHCGELLLGEESGDAHRGARFADYARDYHISRTTV